MDTQVQLRDAVVYIDHQGNKHNALVVGIGPETDSKSDQPAVNLLLIKTTATSEVLDSGSWQTGIEKLTSIVHGSHDSVAEYGRGLWLFAHEFDAAPVVEPENEQEVGESEESLTA